MFNTKKTMPHSSLARLVRPNCGALAKKKKRAVFGAGAMLMGACFMLTFLCMCGNPTPLPGESGG